MISYPEGTEEEKLHIGAFLYELPPDVREWDDEREQPDAEVEFENGQRVGIEHTRLMHEKKRARDRNINDIAAQAQTICRHMNLPPSIVTLYFSRQADLNSANTQSLGDRIAKIVSKEYPEAGEHNVIKTSSGDTKLPAEVSGIDIRRTSIHDDVYCRVGHGAFPDDATPVLRESIRKKDDRYPKYQKFEQMRLLTVYNQPSLSNSAWFSVPEEITSEQFCTKFDRLFLMDAFSWEVIELDTETSDSGTSRASTRSGRRR